MRTRFEKGRRRCARKGEGRKEYYGEEGDILRVPGFRKRFAGRRAMIFHFDSSIPVREVKWDSILPVLNGRAFV